MNRSPLSAPVAVPPPAFPRRARRALLLALAAVAGGCNDAPVMGPDGRPLAGGMATPDGALHAYVLPGVGQATLLVGPTGRTVLYDAGGDATGEALLAGLARFNVRRLDLVVLSHRSVNHEQGIIALAAAKYPVTAVMTSALAGDTRIMMAAESAWVKLGAVLLTPRDTVIDFGGGALLQLVRSPLDAQTSDTLLVSHNNRSISLAATYRGAKFLALGDATTTLVEALQGTNPALFVGVTALLMPDAGSYMGNAFVESRISGGCFVPVPETDRYVSVYSLLDGPVPTLELPFGVRPTHAILSDEESEQAFPACYRRVVEAVPPGGDSAEEGTAEPPAVTYEEVPNSDIVGMYRRAGSIVHTTKGNGVVEVVIARTGLVRVLHDTEVIPLGS